MTQHTDARVLRQALSPYQQPRLARSISEILITAVPLALLWGGAFALVGHGVRWGLILIPPAAVFLVRLFMIQHDCGHSAFFRSRQANDWVGRVIGVFTMTPYGYWRLTHAIHHATSGNLDRRTLGAVDTLTVEEYSALSWPRRLAYRLYRDPLIMFGLGPVYLFIVQHRLPIGLMKEPGAWRSVLANNLGLAVVITGLILLCGPAAVFAVYLSVVALAGAMGVWLFYVQHQFDGAYWARHEQWSLAEASLRGSSHLDLPQPLRWFTANIGAHHIHHLGSRVPFYRLPQVLKDFPQLQSLGRITLADSVKAMKLTLWDEARARLVTFRQAQMDQTAKSEA